MRLLLPCLVLCATVFLPQMASAQARHERTKLTALKTGGKVTGVKIAVVLRPSGEYKKVVMIVGKPIPTASSTEYRQYARGEKPGYREHSAGQVAAPTTMPFEFSLTYGQGNALKSGDVVDVTSLWEGDGSVWTAHVWGMSRQGVPPEQYTLP